MPWVVVKDVFALPHDLGASCHLDGWAYAFGGGSVWSAERYNLVTEVTETLADLPGVSVDPPPPGDQRDGGAIFAHAFVWDSPAGPRIVIFGAVSFTDNFPVIYVYDPATDTYETLNGVPGLTGGPWWLAGDFQVSGFIADDRYLFLFGFWFSQAVDSPQPAPFFVLDLVDETWHTISQSTRNFLDTDSTLSDFVMDGPAAGMKDDVAYVVGGKVQFEFSAGWDDDGLNAPPQGVNGSHIVQRFDVAKALSILDAPGRPKTELPENLQPWLFGITGNDVWERKGLPEDDPEDHPAGVTTQHGFEWVSGGVGNTTLHETYVLPASPQSTLKFYVPPGATGVTFEMWHRIRDIDAVSNELTVTLKPEGVGGTVVFDEVGETPWTQTVTELDNGDDVAWWIVDCLAHFQADATLQEELNQQMDDVEMVAMTGFVLTYTLDGETVVKDWGGANNSRAYRPEEDLKRFYEIGALPDAERTPWRTYFDGASSLLLRSDGRLWLFSHDWSDTYEGSCDLTGPDYPCPGYPLYPRPGSGRPTLDPYIEIRRYNGTQWIDAAYDYEDVNIGVFAGAVGALTTGDPEDEGSGFWGFERDYSIVVNQTDRAWEDVDGVLWMGPGFSLNPPAVVWDEEPYDYEASQSIAYFVVPQHGSGSNPDFVPATPRHMFIGPDGTVAYPLVQGWVGLESFAGGQISSTGTIRASDIEASPGAFASEADWYVFGKETGDTIFHSKVKGPGAQRALVEISGNGPGRLLEADAKRPMWRADGAEGYWFVGQDDPFAAAEPPATKVRIPDANISDSQGAGLNGGVDPYEWAVTFVTAEFETGLGPARSLALDPLDQFFHVTLEDIPIGPTATTARKVYRRDTGATNFKLLTTIADNTTTRYTDSTPDGTLGANAPADINSSAIGIDIRRASVLLHVEPGTPVVTTDRADVVALFVGAEVTKLHLVIHQSKALPDWEVVFSYGEAPDGVMTDFLTVDLAGIESKEVDEEVPQDVDTSMVRARLRRTSNGTELTGFDVRYRALRVYGMATDDDYTTSDVMRDVGARNGISVRGVKESTLPALPQDYPGGTWRDPCDEMGALAGWAWGVWKEGLTDVLHYFPPDDTVWLYTEPEFPMDLVAQQPYNELTLNIKRMDGVVVRSITCHANPDTLRATVTYPSIDLLTPVSIEKATMMCQEIVNQLAQPRWAGSIQFRALRAPNGSLVHGNLAKAGQSIWFPKPINTALIIETLEKGDPLCTAHFPQRVPLIERFEQHNRLMRERALGLDKRRR